MLLKTEHSANIFGTKMYLYGGATNGKESGELSSIDLGKLFQMKKFNEKETFEVVRNHVCSGQVPGILFT